MNDKNYEAKCLLYLFESTGMAGTPEVIPQEGIADSGMDVNPEMMNQNEMDPSMGGQGAMDPSMMNPMDTMQQIPTEPTPETENIVLEKEKFKKLFELFEDLISYSDVFIDNIKYIDTNLLDEQTFVNLRTYFENIKELNKKMKSYLLNFFNKETYEKVLYSYILFRTELITSIKGLRKILELDKPDEKLK